MFVRLALTLILALPTSQAASNRGLIPREEQAASKEYTSDTAFRDAILKVSNQYREEHNATALKWNETLEEMGQKWSEKCVFKHSGNPAGENLAAGYPNASASIDAWGVERDEYSFSKAEFSKKTGHFTQLVWKATTSVGCGRTRCDGKTREGDDDGAPGWYVVCNYWPQGNVIGAFEENVQEQVEGGDGGGGDGGDGGHGGDGKGDGKGDGEKCPLGANCSGAEGLLSRGLGSMWLLSWTVAVAVGGLFMG